MSVRVSKQKLNGFLISFLLLLVAFAIQYYNSYQARKQNDLVIHSNKVLIQLLKFFGNERDLTYYFRSYIITKDSTYADSAKNNLMRAEENFEQLRSLISNQPKQQQNIQELESIVSQRHALYKENLSSKPNVTNDQKDSFLMLGLEIQGRNQLKNHILSMQEIEKSLLAERSAVLDRSNRVTDLVKLIIILMVAGLLIWVFRNYKSEIKARQLADEKSETYKKDLEQKVQLLDEANREIGQLKDKEKFASTGRIARTIAHEIRNPLTNISLASDQMREECEGEDQKMLLQMIDRNTLRINTLITNLLTATKLPDLKLEKINLKDITTDALTLANDRISSRSVKVVKNSMEACDCMLDKEKMTLAISNVITNALDAMHDTKEPVLSIALSQSDSACILEIEDNGPGMSGTDIGKVFDAFYTNKEKGLGLGLTNSRNIIVNQQGTINVEASKLGGLKFVISIPVA